MLLIQMCLDSIIPIYTFNVPIAQYGKPIFDVVGNSSGLHSSLSVSVMVSVYYPRDSRRMIEIDATPTSSRWHETIDRELTDSSDCDSENRWHIRRTTPHRMIYGY